MKKLIITCVMLAGTSLASFAQNQAAAPNANPNGAPQQPTEQQMAERAANQKKAAEGNAERESKVMQQKFGLSEEQYKKIYTVNLDFMNKMMAQRNPANPANRPPSHEDREKMMTEKDAKIKAILTADQYSKWKATQPPIPAPRANQQNNAPQPANK